MLFPVVCPVCERIGAAPCGACIAALEPAGLVTPPRGVDVCLAAIAYEGTGRRLVGALKFRRARDVATWLAIAMAGLVAGERVDAVTWAPTTVSHRSARGFDQAELLARRLARRVDAPTRRLLRRAGSDPQTGRPRHERITGPAFSIAAPVPARVLLVDDVVTTGATLAAAATALRGAGAERVVGVVAATTPPPAVDPLSRFDEVPAPSREAARGGQRQQPSPGDIRSAS